MKTRSLVSPFLLATLAIAADAYKIRTSYRNADLYLQLDSNTDQIVLKSEVGDDFRLSEDSHLVLSSDSSIMVGQKENGVILASTSHPEDSHETWSLDGYVISYVIPLYACAQESSHVLTVDPKTFIDQAVDCFFVEKLVVEEEVAEHDTKNVGPDSIASIGTNNADSAAKQQSQLLPNDDVIIIQNNKRGHVQIIQDGPVDPTQYMIIEFIFMGQWSQMIPHPDDLTTLIFADVESPDALKFKILDGQLMSGDKYVHGEGLFRLLDDPDPDMYWSYINDRLCVGRDQPEPVTFFSCNGYPRIHTGPECQMTAVMLVSNYFVQEDNTVNPRQPMLIKGTLNGERVTFVVVDDEIHLSNHIDDLHASKFTINYEGILENRYKYVGYKDDLMVLVQSRDETISRWLLSGDQLYLELQPRRIHFYDCLGRVSLTKQDECNEIMDIVITNSFELSPNTLDPTQPMVISGALDEGKRVLSTENGEVIVFAGRPISATKFTVVDNYLMAGNKYVQIDNGMMVLVDDEEDASDHWILSGDRLHLGADPKLVEVYNCEGKISIENTECEMLYSMTLTNFDFVQESNTVDPEKPMLIKGQSDGETRVISGSGKYFNASTADDVDCDKFIVEDGYLKVGDKFVANDWNLEMTEDTSSVTSWWILSGDKLYYGANPEPFNFRYCNGRIGGSGGYECTSMAPIVITNFNFEQQENDVNPESPMVISAMLGSAHVVVSIDEDDVIVSEGDAIYGSKFTISRRYLMAGDKYVRIHNGMMVLVEAQDSASYGWFLSGDHLFYGSDPSLVHLYSCANKIAVENSGECEELTPVVILNINFEPEVNTVDSEKQMLIKGEVDGELITFSTDDGFVTEFTGEDVDATKLRIEDGYLKAGDKYVATVDGDLVVVENKGDAERGWVLSGDQLYFGEDPLLVHFYSCAGKINAENNGGCEEVTLIVIQNFDFEPKPNTIDPNEPMVISATLGSENVVITVEDDRITVLEGEPIDGAKFRISEKYLKVGEKYVGVVNGTLVLVSEAGDAAKGWVLSDDQLYLGYDPVLVVLSVCDDGSVHLGAGDCSVLTDITILNVEEEPTTSSQAESTSAEETDTDSETESATGDPSDEPTPIESDSETTSTTTTTTLAGPEPTHPVIDPLKPFTIETLFEDEYLQLLTDGVHVRLLAGDLALFRIDEGYLKVGGDKWVSIAEDGLIVLVGEREYAAFGWRIEEGQLYYEITSRALARDTEVPVTFSYCDIDGEYLLYVGEASGCQVLANVILRSTESPDEPEESSGYESYESEEPSETGETTSTTETSTTTGTTGPVSTSDDTDTTSGTSVTTGGTTDVTSSGSSATATATTTGEASVINVTSCDPSGSCTEIVTIVLPSSQSTHQSTSTTITEHTTLTVTSCEDTRLCETRTEVRSTVYTTYCPVTTATAGVLPVSPKSTITVTICSEGTECEEVVTVVPADQTTSAQTGHPRTLVTESPVRPITSGFENRGVFPELSPIIAGLLVLLHFVL
ncbi:hypothetical protein Cantr_10689 [Candida viswanathii]|uniref:Uncharacterized protein n=1 Tax=Candida viswanathii TaxID=5486 RepID=A0A367YFC2_9ASCO|nr:hypothetical protein Cantr_10689 [Candida viswanathii]